MLLSIKRFLSIVWKNQKLETMVAALSIAYGIFLTQKPQCRIAFFNRTTALFSDTRLSLIIGAISIILGIYIAVISIIATSVLGITRDMLKRGKDKDLLQITFSGMAINAAEVFFCLFFELNAAWKNLVLLALLVMSLIAFIKFMVLTFLIFQANFSQLAKQIDMDEAERADAMTLLNKIEKKISEK